MKCLILAGGSGDRLWPLSRKNYPKQFIAINENRSLLQEAVVRNLPLCDEFFVVTNAAYHFIVEGQFQAFQGVRYRCFLESQGRRTAAAIALVCMFANPGELFCVVSSDTIIEGAGYQEAVLRARELATDGKLVVFGVPITRPDTNYGYIRCQGEHVLSFEEKPNSQTARAYMEQGDYVWNSGMFVFRAGDFLQELGRVCPQVYEACAACAAKTDMSGRTVSFAQEQLGQIPAISVEHAVFEQSDKVSVVLGDFRWRDVGNLEDLENAPIHTNSRRVILQDSDNVTVINCAHRQLVVANELSDAVIVNTEDVTYIGKKGASARLKELIRSHEKEYGTFFENNRLTYRPYGTKEVLMEGPKYRVKKVVLYAGGAISYHKHDYRSEHWSIVEGSVRITLGSEVQDYEANESIFVPVGVGHCVENVTEKPVTIIEVAVGNRSDGTPFGEDLVLMDDRHLPAGSRRAVPAALDAVVRLEPAYKDYLWGGRRLKELFGKRSDLERVAESWELSAHPAGQSVVASGRHKGVLFGEYLKRIGREAWGWKCLSMERFPILVKFLDAREALSVQVHPEDEYALTHEGEYGKNEMWYVLEAQAGACVYMGFSKAVSEQEIRQRVRAGTLPEILRKVPVHKHDTLFIPAGCVHAIGAGVVICEIQQNSNCTYRLYDYNRLDNYQRPRQLHVEKALAVARPEETGRIVPAKELSGERTLIGKCKYFQCVRYEVHGQVLLHMDEASFASLLFVEGEGTVQADGQEWPYRSGDSFFLPAGQRDVAVCGSGCCLVTQV